MEEIGTFLDFHLLNEAKGVQAGAEFEYAFYNQIRKILKQNRGVFKLQLPKASYTVTNIKTPAGASTIKADLKIQIKEEPGELLISLKQIPFPAYAGIADKKRPYLKAISDSPTVQEYIRKLKLFLLQNKSCVVNPRTVPNNTAREKLWLQYNLSKTVKPSKDVDLDSLVCSRNYREYYWTPAEDKAFTNLVVFGDPKFKSEYDYVDYIFKGPKGTVEPLQQIKPRVYSLKPDIDIMAYGDEIPSDLQPTFLSRTMNKRHNYGLLNTRTQLVPRSQAEARNKATAIELK